MKIWLLLGGMSLFCCPTAPVGYDHGIYIGVVQVDHQALGGKAEVNIKVFSDDLQSALRNASTTYRIGPPESCCAQNEALIAAYFANHFTCRINGRAQSLTLENCRAENDVHWLTFSMSCPPDWKEISITADFFMELFSDQSNVISVLHGAERRLFRATKGKESAAAAF